MKSLVFYNINFMLSSTSKALLNKSNSIVKKFLMAASTTNMQRICKSSSQKSLIAVCQMTATSDKERNLRTVLEFIESGKEKGAKMIFFPEASDIIGDSRKQTISLSEPLDGTFVQQCQAASKKHDIWVSIGVHQKMNTVDEKIYNSHIIISSEGKVEACYNKAHLFDLDIPDKVRLCESDYTVPGDAMVAPVATPVGRVGLSTCYDMRFSEMALALTQQGAQILTYPSVFTQTTGMAHWESLLRTRAIETQCYVVASAQTGKHNEKRSSYGHAMVVDPWGTVVSQCSEGQGLCLAEVDLDYLNSVRTNMPVWQHRRPDLYSQVQNLSDSSSKISPDVQETYKFGHVTLSSAQVFYRSLLSIASVNIKPVLPGHTLVMPLRPVVHLNDLSPNEVTDLFMTVQLVSAAVKKHFGASSMTVAVQDGPEAGQTVKHVHVHILPRSQNDFADNDDVYDELQNHDKGWSTETKLRSEEEMREESNQLRQYFYTA